MGFFMLTLLKAAPLLISGWAQLPPDTVVTMPEVVITATRLETDPVWAPSPVATREFRSGSFGLAAGAGEAVAGMPGLFVRDYGASGAVQMLSIRGMGAEQSLVLLDGVPFTNRQSGLTDLSTLPAALLERAELRRGGGSSLFGSEAVGGVLSLETRSPGKRPRAGIYGSTGSFMGASCGVSYDQPITEEAGVLVGMERSVTSGDYPYYLGILPGQPAGVRSDADARAVSAYAAFEIKSANSFISKLVTSFTSSDKGAPGPVFSAYGDPVARQAESDLFLSEALESKLSASTRLKFSLGARDSWLRYLDEGSSPKIDNYYRNQALFAAPAVVLELGSSEHAIAGAEAAIDRATGNALDGVKERRHAGLFLSSALGAYPLATDGPAVALFPSVRVDHFDGFGSVLSAGLGASVGSALHSPAVVVHATIGNNFRAPTFNELYYAGGGGIGNPGLGAERSTNFDCGATLRLACAGDHELSVTYFRITTDNRIIWLPLGSPFVWTARNIGSTRSQGMELVYRWQIVPDRLTLSANYSTNDAVRIAPDDPTAGRQLLYVPLDQGAFAATLALPLGGSTLRAELSDNFTGTRYALDDGTAPLPGFHIIRIDGAFTTRAFGSDLTLGCALHNAADLSYEIMPGYPMPMRNHRFFIHLGHTF
jgi:iron complex outermembrane receptor protein